KTPYAGKSAFQILEFVVTKGLRPSAEDVQPEKIAMLMQECWDADPNMRPAFDEILDRFLNLKTWTSPSPIKQSPNCSPIQNSALISLGAEDQFEEIKH